MIFITAMPTASPSEAECSTLYSYASSLVTRLKAVQTTLGEASTNPDESLKLIREKVSEMISDAESVKRKISSIQTSAANFSWQSSFPGGDQLNGYNGMC